MLSRWLSGYSFWCVRPLR